MTGNDDVVVADERDTADLFERLSNARALAVGWLTERVAPDGRPEGAEVRNSWWRAPWALAVAGAPGVAASMMGWIEREALLDNGELRPGPYAVPAPGSPVYHLSAIAISAWLLARYDIAETVNSRLREFQDPQSGGFYEYVDFGADPLQDNLKTAQGGISALVTGDRHTADGVYQWLARNFNDQPQLPAQLFTSRRHGRVVTDFPARETFIRLVRFSEPRQAYFHPGIAAAFLAGYHQQTGRADALALGREYLALTTDGTERQFDDATSVQICKFGWGAAAMLGADPTGGHRPWVERMGAWFCDRQRPDGSWAPSSFACPEPGVLDLYWKTAEHLMELSYIELALAAAPPVTTNVASQRND